MRPMRSAQPVDRAVDTVRWTIASKEFSAPATPALLHEPLVDSDPARSGAQYQNRINSHGRYYWQRTASHVWHESVLELRCLERLDFEGEVLRVAAQPFEVTFREGADTQRHTPDFFGLLRDGSQVVYDVKPLGRMTEKVQVQFAETARVCTAIGWRHEVLHEGSEMSTMVLSHLRKSRHPNSCPSTDVRDQARQVFADGRPLAQGREMLNRRHPALAMPYIKHLIWHGILRVDIERPLTLDTVVRSTSEEQSCSCG